MSLVQTLTDLITPQLVGALSSRLGESETAVAKGLQGGAAALLGGIANRATDTSFLSQILSLVNSGGGAAGILGSLGAMAAGGSNPGLADIGGKLLNMVLGSNQNAVTSALGQATGLKGSSASSLLSMAGPLVLGLLGKQVAGGGVSSLASMLSSEAGSIKNLLPGGLGSLLSMAAPSMPSVSSPSISVPEESSSNKWLLPLLLAGAAIAGLIWWMNRGAEPMKEAVKEATPAVETAVNTVQTQANAAWAALGDLFKRKLPSGLELNIPKLGVENRLIDFIEDASKPIDKTTWFDFDRLLFDTGKATLQAASREQLENVANILKAFPNVELKIGGYTDNVGDPKANMALSAARAKTVMDELVGMGIAATRLTSEGYGDQHPVADNATEDGKAKNRRVSMRVTKK
jgi:OmpA-OmpF porin, OOP family